MDTDPSVFAARYLLTNWNVMMFCIKLKFSVSLPLCQHIAVFSCLSLTEYGHRGVLSLYETFPECKHP